MDERTEHFLDSFQTFLDEVLPLARQGSQEGRPRLAEVVGQHLGVDPSSVPVIRLDVPGHQFVNLDVAIETLVAQHGGGRIVGVGGGDQRHHQTFGDLLTPRGPLLHGIEQRRAAHQAPRLLCHVNQAHGGQGGSAVQQGP